MECILNMCSLKMHIVHERKGRLEAVERATFEKNAEKLGAKETEILFLLLKSKWCKRWEANCLFKAGEVYVCGLWLVIACVIWLFLMME